MTRIQVKFFAILREKTGYELLNVEFPRDISGADVLSYLKGEFSNLWEIFERSRLAVNGDFADEKTLLRSGSVVCILPPMSGG